MLSEFVIANRDEIIRRCRAKVVRRSGPPPTKVEIDHGVPMFLDQLIAELRAATMGRQQIDKTALEHGHDLLRQGFTVSQVVHDYGDICQSITELAIETDASIGSADFGTLNRCLDDAIASAVTQYGAERDESIQGGSAGENERLLALALELRTSIHVASVAMEAIDTGRVGFEGSTGTMLKGKISRAHDLIDHLLVEVRAVRATTDGGFMTVGDSLPVSSAS